MRLAIYSDLDYRRCGDTVFADQAFVVFMAALRHWVDALTLVGRLDPQPGRWHHRVPDGVSFVALPHYSALSHQGAALRTMGASCRRFWRLLDDVDAVWLLGPHPLALAFAVIAALRRRRIVIGVRQDLLAYVRNRHAGRWALHLSAAILELAWRTLGTVLPVVAVGSDLARRYAPGREVLETSVSLVSEEQLTAPNARRDYRGELQVLSVGRLDAEKNPLLLADVLAALLQRDRRWRLVVCGDGPLRPALEMRLDELGVRDRCELLGYVPVDAGLLDVYLASHALLHVSWTEGFPQVLIEAFAARLPVVATRVGGVAEMARDAALLVAPGDPLAAARALEQIAADADLRSRLTAAGVTIARSHTVESETRRVADLIAGRTRAVAGSRA